MFRLALLGIFSIAAFFLFAFGPVITTVDTTPLNEAFITPVRDIPPLQAVAAPPGVRINETVPPQPDQEMLWIPGYWAYNSDLSDFVWVTGAWRRPPPGHTWISGKWADLPEGWVWISGFWSAVPENSLTYIQKRPPDQIDEEAGMPGQDNYFWMPGYWSYDEDTNDFEWVGGQWAALDRNWVFVPAHYVWTEKGYVFIAAYWDFPLELRGAAYSPIYVQPADRADYTYEPTDALDASYISDSLLPYYPDYGYYYGYDYLCRPDYWNTSDVCPPWWGWNNWCGISWTSQWGLWWWYTHPGYRQPSWITPEDARAIVPASKNLTNRFKGVSGPTIVHSAGVYSPNTLLRAGQKVWGNEFANIKKGAPVVPYRRTIGTDALPRPRQESPILYPTGSSHHNVPIPRFSSEQKQISHARRLTQNQPVKPRQARQSSAPASSEMPKPSETLKHRSPTQAAQNRPRVLPPTQRHDTHVKEPQAAPKGRETLAQPRSMPKHQEVPRQEIVHRPSQQTVQKRAVEPRVVVPPKPSVSPEVHGQSQPHRTQYQQMPERKAPQRVQAHPQTQQQSYRQLPEVRRVESAPPPVQHRAPAAASSTQGHEHQPPVRRVESAPAPVQHRAPGAPSSIPGHGHQNQPHQ